MLAYGHRKSLITLFDFVIKTAIKYENFLIDEQYKIT